LQKDSDDGLAIESDRFQVLYIVDQSGQTSLIRSCDAALDVFGVEAGKLPRNRDNRNVDIREDIGRSPAQHDGAEDQYQQRYDDESIRPVKSDSDYPHIRLPESGASRLHRDGTIIGERTTRTIRGLQGGQQEQRDIPFVSILKYVANRTLEPLV